MLQVDDQVARSRTTAKPSSSAGVDPRRWAALALLCTAFLMTVLDLAIVNVALPSIGRGLRFPQGDLQWVVTAYSITFGGFLLLGGRGADLLGRRRLFMSGLALFTLASLGCGLAGAEWLLVLMRSLQGLGAAIITPAALSIVSTTFGEGAERNRALGVWGAVGGSGGAIGVLLGGLLTRYLGWESIFFINVPVGLAVLALTPRLIPESRVSGTSRRYDAAGAISVTAGLMLLVYAISQGGSHGWLSVRALALLAGSALLLVAFVVIEARAPRPLLPLGIFRRRSLAGANVAGFLFSAAFYTLLFVLTLFMQQVLGYSALQTGLAYLAMVALSVALSPLGQALTTRLGPAPVLTAGLVIVGAGMLWLTRISPHSGYTVDLLPGLLLAGVGMAFTFIPINVAALSGVAGGEAGLASGLINTSQQLGGALGVAALGTVATSHTASLMAHGVPLAAALTSGFAVALWVTGGITAAAALATIALLRRPAPVVQKEA